MAHRIYLEENGEIHEITIAESEAELTDNSDSERESYGLKDDAIAKLQDIHETIRFYTKYAIGAFQRLPGAEVEEVTLKFGLKISGETGVPVLTKASTEANFEIEVKCKPKPKNQ